MMANSEDTQRIRGKKSIVLKEIKEVKVQPHNKFDNYSYL